MEYPGGWAICAITCCVLCYAAVMKETTSVLQL